MTFGERLELIFMPRKYYKRLLADVLSSQTEVLTLANQNEEKHKTMVEGQQRVIESQAKEIAEVKNSRLFNVSSNIRSKIFMNLISERVKEFDNINGHGLYIEDRDAMVYEIIRSTIVLDNAKFSRCNFDKAIFGHTEFKNTVFNDVSFVGAHFDEVKFINCEFGNCKFDNSRGENVTFTDCRENNSNLSVMELSYYVEASDDELNEYENNHFENDENDMEI